MRLLGRAALAAGALISYALVEPYRYRLTNHKLQGRAGGPALKILHISDLHLKGRDRKLARFVTGLKALDDIDVVLATGDLIEDDSGIEPLVEALSVLKGRLGCFYVLGSHDYHQSRFKSYAKYFTGKRGAITAPQADTGALEAGLVARGWQPLTNRSTAVETEWGRLKLAGVDDPYLGRHDVRVIQREHDDTFAIGLVHAPDVVSEWFLAGFDLVVAGHTHAGQVRVPLYGALVTNCSLPTTLAGGAHRIGNGWLHVSPGLGTGRFSPIRFDCRPEATVLEFFSLPF